MDNKTSNIKERVLQIAEFKGIAKERFCESIGMTYGNFKGKSKETPLNSNAIADILTLYPDISSNWLITGKGIMTTDTNPNSITEDEKGLPLIPIDAMAGYGTGSQQIMDYDSKKYNVPEFTELNAEFMIRVKGSSMHPKYNSGDLLACRKISMSFFQWNKVYVLDTEQGALIKRIKPSEKENYIQCISDNHDYDPFELDIDEINSVAIVLGVIRLE